MCRDVCRIACEGFGRNRVEMNSRKLKIAEMPIEVK